MHNTEHKTLKFTAKLVPLIKSGKKVSTWRLWDDKNLSVGDVLDLAQKETLEKFAEARITRIVEKPLGELTEDDKDGHERFASDEEMYATYAGYYHREVGPETPIKLVWFELI